MYSRLEVFEILANLSGRPPKLVHVNYDFALMLA